MIRPLRTAHVRLWLLVLPVALGALAIALLTRAPRPIEGSAPPGAAAAPERGP